MRLISRLALTAILSFTGLAGLTAQPAPPDGNPPGPPPSGDTPAGAPPGGQASAPSTYQANLLVSAKTVSEADKTYTSTKTDSSGVAAVQGATVSLKNATVAVKGASSNEEASNFWGTNAGVLAAGASKVTMTGGTITTQGAGSNAVFSTGASQIAVSDLTITTTKDSSRGIDATYGGVITAKNLKITTAGAHSAAIATDRGEGTITVTGGTMKTSGQGSPGIYSTGDIRVIGAQLTATGSEAAVIEGRNSITLTDTVLSGAVKHGVMLYQSFSGDAAEGTSTFTMTGGKLTALAGPLFYSTNTRAVVNLKNATLVQKSGLLFQIAAGQWGSAGKNGAFVTLNAENQVLEGDVEVEAISTLTLNLGQGATWTGAADKAKTAKEVNVKLAAGATWVVTADSRVNVLDNGGTIQSQGHTILYKASSNPKLGGKTITLADGGQLKPY